MNDEALDRYPGRRKRTIEDGVVVDGPLSSSLSTADDGHGSEYRNGTRERV